MELIITNTPGIFRIAKIPRMLNRGKSQLGCMMEVIKQGMMQKNVQGISQYIMKDIM